MTCPLKFRQKVFATKDKYSLAFEPTSERFDIPIRTLFRWQNKLQPCTTRNQPATRIDRDALAKELQTAPDDYQWERAKRLGVAQRTVGYALKRLAISGKKTLARPKADEAARAASQKKRLAYEARGKAIVY